MVAGVVGLVLVSIFDPADGKHVGTAAAVDDVVTPADRDELVAVATVDGVVAAPAIQVAAAVLVADQGAGAAVDLVVAVAAADVVLAGTAVDCVVAVVAVQRIVAVAADDEIVAVAGAHVDRGRRTVGPELVVIVGQSEGPHAVEGIGVAEGVDRVPGCEAADGLGRHVDEHAARAAALHLPLFAVVDEEHPCLGVVGKGVVALAAGDTDGAMLVIRPVNAVVDVEAVGILTAFGIGRRDEHVRTGPCAHRLDPVERAVHFVAERGAGYRAVAGAGCERDSDAVTLVVAFVGQPVVAVAAMDLVAALVAAEEVVAPAAVEGVVARVAAQRVPVVVADDVVVEPCSARILYVDERVGVAETVDGRLGGHVLDVLALGRNVLELVVRQVDDDAARAAVIGLVDVLDAVLVVAAVAAVDHVVALAADQRVAAIAAINRVVAAMAENLVPALEAIDDFRGVAAMQLVVVLGAVDRFDRVEEHVVRGDCRPVHAHERRDVAGAEIEHQVGLVLLVDMLEEMLERLHMAEPAQVDLVSLGNVEPVDRVDAFRDAVGIRAVAARGEVIAPAQPERIVAAAALEGVVAVVTDQQVIAGAADDQVVALPAIGLEGGAVTGMERVVAVGQAERLDPDDRVDIPERVARRARGNGVAVRHDVAAREIDRNAEFALATPAVPVVIVVAPLFLVVVDHRRGARPRRVGERVAARAAHEAEGAEGVFGPVAEQPFGIVGRVEAAVEERIVARRAHHALEVDEIGVHGVGDRTLIVPRVMEDAGNRARAEPAGIQHHMDVVLAVLALEADHVVAVATIDGVFARRAVDVVEPAAPGFDVVVAGAAVEIVVEVVADEGVVAVLAFEVAARVILARIPLTRQLKEVVAAASDKFRASAVRPDDDVAEVGAADALNAVELVDVAEGVDRRVRCDIHRGVTPLEEDVLQHMVRQVDDHAMRDPALDRILLLLVLDEIRALSAIERVGAGIAGKVVVLLAAVEQVGVVGADHDLDVVELVGRSVVELVDLAALRPPLGDDDAGFLAVVLDVVVFLVALATIHVVGAAAAVEEVVVLAAKIGVVAVAPVEVVVAVAGIYPVIAVAALAVVIAVAANDGVVAATPLELVVAAIAGEVVVAVLAVEIVVFRPADDHVAILRAAGVLDVDQAVAVAIAVERLEGAELGKAPASDDDSGRVLIGFGRSRLAREVHDHAMRAGVAVMAPLGLPVILDAVVFVLVLAADHGVVAATADEEIRLVVARAAAHHRVVAAAATQVILAVTADQGVVAVAAPQFIMAGATFEVVAAAIAREVVVGIAADDVVGKVGALDVLDVDQPVEAAEAVERIAAIDVEGGLLVDLH